MLDQGVPDGLGKRQVTGQPRHPVLGFVRLAAGSDLLVRRPEQGVRRCSLDSDDLLTTNDVHEANRGEVEQQCTRHPVVETDRRQGLPGLVVVSQQEQGLDEQ